MHQLNLVTIDASSFAAGSSLDDFIEDDMEESGESSGDEDPVAAALNVLRDSLGDNDRCEVACSCHSNLRVRLSSADEDPVASAAPETLGVIEVYESLYQTKMWCGGAGDSSR